MANVIKAKDEITITIESAALQITKDTTIVIPAGLDKKTLNLEFTNTFKKATAVLTISDQDNLSTFNITLPSGDFGKLKVSTKYATTKIVSAGTTNVEFRASVGTDKTLTLGSGLDVVATQDITGTVKADGATVSALMASANVSGVTKDGAKTAIKKGSDDIYVKEIIADKNITIAAGTFDDNVKNSPLTKVTVAEGKTLTLNTAVKEVVGVLQKDDTTGETSVTAKVKTESKYLATVEDISNVTITGSGELEISKTAFSGTKFDGFDTYTYTDKVSAAKGVEFNKSTVNITVPAQADADSYKFTFTDVPFASGTKFNVKEYKNTAKLKDSEGKDVEVTYYYWIDATDVEAAKKLTGTVAEKVDTIKTATINTAVESKYEDFYDKYRISVSDSIKNLSKNLQDDVAKSFANMGNYHIAYEKADDEKVASKVRIYYYAIDKTINYVDEDDADKTIVGVTAKKYYLDDKYVASSKSIDDIPVWIMKDYTTNGNLYLKMTEKSDTAVDYANFTVIFAFDGCKYGKDKLTKDNLLIDKVDMPKDEEGEDIKVKVRYEIDGKLYEPRLSDTTNQWFLY